MSNLQTILLSRNDDIITKSVEVAMSSTSSPQYKAMNWLVNDDPMALLSNSSSALEEERLIVKRYILNVIYFSFWESTELGGSRQWMECAESCPKSNFSPCHRCNADGEVEGLSLGELCFGRRV